MVVHFIVAICHRYHCFLMLPVEPMVPPSGLQTFRKCLAVRTYIHKSVAQLDLAYLRAGKVGMYILQPETLTGLVFPCFLPVEPLTGEQMPLPWPEAVTAQPQSCVVLQWCLGFFSKTYITESIHLCAVSLMQEAKHVMLVVVLLMLKASELSQPSVVQVFFLGPCRKG